jgi:hypothetical protein
MVQVTEWKDSMGLDSQPGRERNSNVFFDYYDFVYGDKAF